MLSGTVRPLRSLYMQPSTPRHSFAVHPAAGHNTLCRKPRLPKVREFAGPFKSCSPTIEYFLVETEPRCDDMDAKEVWHLH